jgi:hypothetical protein
MADAVALTSRHPLAHGGELIVVVDDEGGVERLITAEQRVARVYAAHGRWPHSRVNLFVFETLQPLIDQLRRASRTLGESEAIAAAASGLDRKPMVQIYNLADLAQCSIFVNRSLMMRLGMWDNDQILEGLLAHEHAHPLSDNGTTRVARTLQAALVERQSTNSSALPAGGPVQQALGTLAHELCVHAPHEVFANEFAVRAGFGDCLFALNRMSLNDGRAGLAARAALADRLQIEVAAGRQSEDGAALLLLLASIEAHARVALETSAFARAGNLDDARALEDLLWQEALSKVEAEAGSIYRALHASYLALKPDMDETAVRAWAEKTFEPILIAIAGYGGARYTASFHY